MMMRDKTKSPDYWKEHIAENNSLIDDTVEYLKNQEDYNQRLGETYDLLKYGYDSVSSFYSAGHDMTDVTNAARELVMQTYPRFVSVCQENPAKSRGEYAGGWDERYKYLSFAILLRLSVHDSKALVESLDFWNEGDKGMGLMMAYLGHSEGRLLANTLLWPDAYQELFLAMSPDTPHANRSNHLDQFLKNWLKEMRSSTNPAYNNHNNKHNIYFGYWCWEAAAVAVMMDIDDERFREHKHYPKDFADWSRDEMTMK